MANAETFTTDEQPATLIVTRADCESCHHPASDHTGPGLVCRLCSDRYEYRSEDDVPSETLLGE